MLRRVKVNKNIERKITIAFITSTSFNKKIRTTYKKEYIELEYAQKIIGWSLQYFDQYTIAPGIHIQDIFDIERPSLKEPLADLIELFLLDISEEYERSELLNVDYLIDQTKSYFRNRALEILFKKGHKLVSSGRTEEAERLLTSHKQVSKVTSGRFDPFDPLSIMSYGFSINENELFKFTGDLGDLLGWFERSWLVAVMAPEKRGKCLSGSQRILLSNGTYLPLSQVVEQEIIDIVSFDEDNQKFIKSSVSEFWRNGIKKVYKITTRTGRQVEVTNNHPFLTPNGWKELKDIGKGGFIAVPKKLNFFGNKKLSDHKIKLLAYFIADGCLREGIGFTTSHPNRKKDFEECIEKMDCSVTWRGIGGEVTNSKHNKGKHNKNYVRNMIKKYKLYGKLSYDKTIPEDVLQLPKNKIALFLRILFTCDGWVTADGKEIGFNSSSIILAKQVHNLLTKFGIVSQLSLGLTKNKDYVNGTISIGDYENIELFIEEIGFVFSKQKKAKEALKERDKIYRSFLDKLPWQIAKKFHDEVKEELGGGKRIEKGPKSLPSKFCQTFTKASSVREQIVKKAPLMRQSFSEVKNTKTGKKYLNSKILWDEIIDIQYIREEETYDLTVDKHHNFVAEDILVHNSWLLEEIVFAALTARLKVFLVSLEMNKTQLQKRTYQKMTGLDAIKSQDCGLPVLDCLNNQDNSCLMKRRTCDCSAPTDLTRNTEYKPCTICKGKSDKYIPAVYHTYLKTNEMKIKLIRDKVKSFSKMYGRNLRIKSYPRFSANIYDVINELDDLEYSENFIPDVIVIDYLDILAYPPGSYKSEREFINTTWKTAAQIAGERNCLVLTADQADAPSRGKRNLDQTSFTDDKRKDAHLDMRIAINQTFDEKERKIARITNLFHRHRYFHPEKEVLILQELSLGQPLLDSVWWNKKFEKEKEE